MSVSLSRRFGLLQATALNMSNMIGIGPFITIPILMSALGRPAGHARLARGGARDRFPTGWCGASSARRCRAPAAATSTCARRTAASASAGWSRSSSSGSSSSAGRSRSPPATSGSRDTRGTSGRISRRAHVFARRGRRRLLNVVLLYRRIEAIGTLTVSLWIGTLLTTAAVIASGALHFDAARAFDFPPGAFDFSLGFLLGLGAASRVGIYDYLGYYDICYIGDEVKDPGRVIPRSILISIVAVAAIYLAINLSIIGVVPMARVRAGRRASAVRVHRLDVHGAALRAAGRDRVHVSDPVDRVRLGVRAAPRLLAHPVCRRAATATSSACSAGCTRPSDSRTSR